MKRFFIVFEIEKHEMTGSGIVGEGCLFNTGKVAVTIYGKYNPMQWADSIEAVEFINCYKNDFYIRWVDEVAVKNFDEKKQ